jgi:hypothetical protein
VLFFIDETWQDIDGMQVAALGGVAIRQSSYNAFCREVFAIKKNVLGAVELGDAELKGAKCFARRTFRRRDKGKQSKLLDAADELFDTLEKYGARTFAIWTSIPSIVSLRSAQTTELSPAYKQMLFDFRALMRAKAPARLGSLNFDQRDLGSDEAAACALQNYLVRTRGHGWDRHLITVPNFTVSAISPGLQSADLVAYLGAQCASRTRPELQPYIQRVLSLQYEWDEGSRRRRSVREIRGTRKGKEPAGKSPKRR